MSAEAFASRQIEDAEAVPVGAWGFRGVRSEGERWVAEGGDEDLGRFSSKEAAARAHDRFVLAELGTDARLNFHPRTYLTQDGDIVPEAEESESESSTTISEDE